MAYDPSTTFVDEITGSSPGFWHRQRHDVKQLALGAAEQTLSLHLG
jgi:hypothetical protein